MQSLFRLENDLSAGSRYIQRWPYLQKGLLQNIEKIEHYYQTYSIPAASSHIIEKLITAMGIPLSLEYDRYVANAYSSSRNVAQALKMTTSSSRGQVWDGVFYGQGSKEIIIAHEDYFNIFAARDNWKRMTPVTVLTHHITNSRFLIPDGKTTSKETGLAVIAINVPMLMAMYYCWVEEQTEKARRGEVRQTINQFVHGYALTGMIRTHADNVMLNNLYANSTGLPVVPSIRQHSFFTSDYTSDLAHVVEEQNIYVRNSQSHVLGTLGIVQVPCAGTMKDMSKLPRLASTMQCFWALVLARVKMLAYVAVTQKSSEKRHSSEFSNIAYLMKIYQARNSIKGNLGMEAYYEIAPMLDRIGI